MLTDSSYLDAFCRGALTVTSPFVIIMLMLIGFVFLKKEAFGRAFFVFAFAMILNPFLKELFQVPPAPGANPNGLSFPSGHMLTSAALWIWLAWEYKNKLFSAFVILLLTIIGFSLVYCDYHYPIDIAGALFFALLILFLYYWIIKLTLFQKNPPLIGFFLAALAIPFILFIPNALGRSNIWIAYGALLGFATGWLIYTKFFSKNPTSFPIKLLIFVLGILSLVAIKYLFSFIQTKYFLMIGIHYFVVALCLTTIPQGITYALFRNRHNHKQKSKAS